MKNVDGKKLFKNTAARLIFLAKTTPRNSFALIIVQGFYFTTGKFIKILVITHKASRPCSSYLPSTSEAAQLLIHALISWKLDSYNSLMHGLRSVFLDKRLQHVLTKYCWLSLTFFTKISIYYNKISMNILPGYVPSFNEQ